MLKAQTIVPMIVIIMIVAIILPVATGLITHNNTNSTSSIPAPVKTALPVIPIIIILAVIFAFMYIMISVFRGNDYNEPVRKPNPYLTDIRQIYPNDNRVRELKKIISKLKNVPDDMKDELLK